MPLWVHLHHWGTFLLLLLYISRFFSWPRKCRHTTFQQFLSQKLVGKDLFNTLQEWRTGSSFFFPELFIFLPPLLPMLHQFHLTLILPNVKFREVRFHFTNLLNTCFQTKIPIKGWSFQTIQKNINLANCEEVRKPKLIGIQDWLRNLNPWK